jgi:acetyl-CoA synthetase
MSEGKLYPVPAAVAAHAWINNDQYLAMYQRSVDDPEGFWAEQANQFVTWFKPWDKVLDWDFTKGHIRWFEGATLNVSYNCLDRHLATRGDQVAIIWEGDNPKEDRKVTYKELHTDVCKFANVLKSLGIKKGDRVCIYMPMIPETAVAMLACTRIGAIHSIVFGGFSPESLKDRILDATCNLVITSDEGLRGGRNVPMKANIDKALLSTPSVQKTVVVTIKRRAPDARYGKIQTLRVKYKAHAADHDYPKKPTIHEGDTVLIAETRPTSKDKRWRVMKVIERAAAV